MVSIFDGAPSVEVAIAEVSAKKHLSTDAVEKHWKGNQEMLWDMYGEAFREIGFADMRDAVKSWTAANRKNPEMAAAPYEDSEEG
jgi:hypothetical protein